MTYPSFLDNLLVIGFAGESRAETGCHPQSIKMKSSWKKVQESVSLMGGWGIKNIRASM